MAYSGGLDKAIKGWNSTSTSPVTNFEGHSEGVTVIRLDHREEKVFSGSEDYSVKIWDLQKRMCERVLTGHKDHVTDLAVTKNSEVLFSSSLDGTIKVWKLSEEFRCFNTIYEHKGPVHALAMSPKAKILYSASEDKSIKVWDLSTLKCLGTLDEHDKGVNSICVGNQESYLYSGSEDCTIKIWSTKTLQCIDTLVGHLAGISRIITRLGEDINLFSAGKDKIIKGWSAEERICKITFKGHKDQVYDLALSKNKNLLLSCSLDKTIKVWAIKTGECINTFYGHSDSVTCLYAFRKSDSIMSGSKDRSIKLWGLDIPSTNTLIGKGHTKEVTCIRPLVKGEFLMSMGADNTIRFWSTSTMQQVKVLSTESTGFTGALVMDESMLVIGSADNSLRVMDLADESTKMRVEPNGEAISCLAVSANGDFIFSGSKRGNSTIRVTHLVSGNEVRDLIGHRSPVNCLCLVDSLGLLISGSQDRDIRVWDVHQMECKNTLKGHGEGVSCLLLDPRGIFFYSGSSDRTVKVWSMKQLNLVVTFQGHEGDVVALAANSRGNLLFSASCDHTIKIWSTIDFSLIETFDTKEDIVRSLNLVLEDRFLCGGGDTGMIYSWDLSTVPNFRGLDMYSLECLYGFMIAETYQEKENNLKNFINCLSQSNDAHYIHRVNPNLFTASLEFTRVLEFSLNAFGYCSVTSVEDDDLLFRILKDDSKRNNHLETLCDYLCNNISQIRFYNKIINQLIVSSNLKVQKLLMALFEKDVEPQQGSFLRRKGKLKQTPICLEIQNAKIISESEQQAILKKSKDLNSIDWLITKFPIDLRNGCICSRDFFRGLDDCSYEVIMSDFQHLINYKWKLLRPYILVHGMGFWALIICMSYHIVFAQTSTHQRHQKHTQNGLIIVNGINSYSYSVPFFLAAGWYFYLAILYFEKVSGEKTYAAITAILTASKITLPSIADQFLSYILKELWFSTTFLKYYAIHGSVSLILAIQGLFMFNVSFCRINQHSYTALGFGHLGMRSLFRSTIESCKGITALVLAGLSAPLISLFFVTSPQFLSQGLLAPVVGISGKVVSGVAVDNINYVLALVLLAPVPAAVVAVYSLLTVLFKLCAYPYPDRPSSESVWRFGAIFAFSCGFVSISSK